jgi:hypothetical protein
MKTTVTKKVNLRLVGIDSNAFALIGAFSRRAKKEGWAREEIEAVLNDATSGNYPHLVSTLSSHCIDPVNGREAD